MLYLDCNDDFMTVKFVKTHQNVNLKQVNFNLRNLPFNRPDIKKKSKNNG